MPDHTPPKPDQPHDLLTDALLEIAAAAPPAEDGTLTPETQSLLKRVASLADNPEELHALLAETQSGDDGESPEEDAPDAPDARSKFVTDSSSGMRFVDDDTLEGANG